MPRLPEPPPSGAPSAKGARALLAPDLAAEVRSLIERANRDYLYWDRFKQLKMPAGVAPEDAWHYLKSVRSLSQQETPVVDVHGHFFSYSLTGEVQRCLHVIDREAAGAVTAPGRIPKHGEQRYLISSLMEEAIASSQIEGAATTRRVAKDMLRAGRRPANTSEHMILNNYRTIAALAGLRDECLTPESIVGIQAMLTEGTLEDPEDVGRVRRRDDIIVHDSSTLSVLHIPPPAAEIAGELQRLCDYANSTEGPFEHPVVKAAILHFWLAYLHPFPDGNGRTARSLFYLHMLKNDYWLFEYLSISRVILRRRGQYDRAYLYSEADGCDMTYFLTFHLHAVEDALAELWSYLADKAKEDGEIVGRLAGDRSLNHRQRAVVGRALEDAEAEFTIESHRTSHDISYPTARADLLDLAERGLLEQRQAGRAFIFTPARDLRIRLSPRDDL